jgi:hypothetical protein
LRHVSSLAQPLLLLLLLWHLTLLLHTGAGDKGSTMVGLLLQASP